MTRAAAERAGLLGTDGSYLWACLAAVSLASTRAFDVCGRRLDDFGLLVAYFSLFACCHGDRVPPRMEVEGKRAKRGCGVVFVCTVVCSGGGVNVSDVVHSQSGTL